MAVVRLLTPEGVEYRPLPKQRLFHANPATFRAYIGGWGSGKSLANANECLLTALRYPGSDGVLGRWSKVQLRATTWDTLIKITPPELIHKYNQTEMVLEIKTSGKPSRIRGVNLQEHIRLASLNLGWFGIDEVTEVPNENVFLQLMGRLRGVGPQRGWVTGNPNGKDWVYRLWVENQPDPKNYWLIQAPTEENSHLSHAYMERLTAGLPPDWKERYLSGSFEAFEGQVYPEFSRQLHVVPPELMFEIPLDWPIFRGIDHGLSHPTCCLFATVAPDGTLYYFDEYYVRGKLISENCQAILARYPDRQFDWSVIDPSTRRRSAISSLSYVDEYKNNGIPCRLADNDLLPGIARMKELWRVDPNRENPLTGERGSPRAFVFPTCPRLIHETIQSRWKDHGGQPGKEEPVDYDNHATDAARYIAMENPQSRVVADTEGRIWNRWQSLLDEINEERGPTEPHAIGSSTWMQRGGA